MNLLFVDTAGWMASADAADPENEPACAARDRWLEAEGLLITSDYVINETLTASSSSRTHCSGGMVAWHGSVQTRRARIDP